MDLDYKELLLEIATQVSDWQGQGKVADYIPALARVCPKHFGMSIHTVDNQQYSVGDADTPFSIQSISKVFGLTLALKLSQSDIWRRVGFEPSGNPFNSLSQLEYEQGIPRNPMINAGALVVTDCINSHSPDPVGLTLDFSRKLTNNPKIGINPEVSKSEWNNRFRNAALCNYLKSLGNIHGPVDKILDIYFKQCSMEMSCKDLAKAFCYLANSGYQPGKTEPVISAHRVRRINSILLTSGTYDEAGEFAFHVGLPCKSGVGGGIVAIVPNRMAICTWAPELGTKGNSVVGMKALKYFTRASGLSIFG